MDAGGRTAQSEVERALRVGDVLGGKYVITGEIGAGGMGIVLTADDRDLRRTVAVKMLLPHLARDGEATARFLREARAAAAIQSEHVVRILVVDRLEGGAPYIVMEHLRGSDLAGLLRERGPLSADEAIDYVLQACEALAEAHALGVVHRDLKPQNLFLTRRADGSPLVKVLDFGISKGAPADGRDSLTGPSAVLGSPLYMSPEQIKSPRDVDVRSDVWSLGVVLFELLTGEPVFRAATASAVYAMILSEPARPLTTVRPGFRPELEQVILRCVEKDPARRYADIGQFARALTPLAPERAQRSIQRIERIVEAVAATDRASAVPARIAEAIAAPPQAPPMPASTHAAPAYAPAMPAPTPPPAPRTVAWWPFAVAGGVVVAVLGAAAIAAFLFFGARGGGPVAPSSVSAVTTAVAPATPATSASAPQSPGSAAAPASARSVPGHAKPSPSASAAPSPSASSGLSPQDLDLSNRRAAADERDMAARRPGDVFARSNGFMLDGKAGDQERSVLRSACTLMKTIGPAPIDREHGELCLEAIDRREKRGK